MSAVGTQYGGSRVHGRRYEECPVLSGGGGGGGESLEFATVVGATAYYRGFDV